MRRGDRGPYAGLLQRYHSPPNPEAFSGINNVALQNNISSRRAAEALAYSESYTLHRRYRRPVRRNPYYIMYRRQMAQLDLIDKRNLAEWNDGHQHIVVCLDCFSRKCWAVPILSKAATHMIPAMETILRMMGEPPEQIFADRGSEIKSAEMRALLASKGIRLVHPNSEIKASMVERANQSIQSLIHHYATDREGRRWIDILDMLIDTYNSRPHRSLDHLSPNSAELEFHKNRVASALREHYSKALTGQRIRFRVGDRVRLKTGYGMAFARGFEEQFSQEQYVVHSVNRRMGVPMYRIKSLDTGKIIAGCCYAEELQLVRGDVYRFIVLERKVRNGVPMMKIRWRGFSEAHDQWVREDMPVETNFQQQQQARRGQRGGLA